MIYLTQAISPEKIGSELHDDRESLSQVLVALSQGYPDDIGESVADYLGDEEKEAVFSLLSNIAAAISDKPF